MLTGYPVVIEVPVRWRDIDALGHVTNTMYLEYFSMARVVYYERIGMPPPRRDAWDKGFIIAEAYCRYRAPVTYPDTLSVGARVAALSNDRFLMEFAVYSHTLDKRVADGNSLVVSYDYEAGARTPLGARYREAIAALEGSEPPPLPPRSKRGQSGE